jgi:hypothetical protein
VNINKYRDLCRQRIRECEHPLITTARKFVLLRLVDYINGDDFTAWPAFDTLADDLGIDRSTVIRAINAGRKAGLLERIYKGGKTRRGGTSNRYRFNLDLVAGEPLGQPPTQWQNGARPSGTPATQSSKDHLKNRESDGVSEEKKVVGEEDVIPETTRQLRDRYRRGEFPSRRQ